MSKDSLRKDVLHKLSLLSNDEFQSLNRSLTTEIIKLLRYFPELQGQLGAAYLPLKLEIAPNYEELLKCVSVNLAYPILTHDGGMSFGVPHGKPSGAAWLTGSYHEVIPQWGLIPGIGFDLKGSRLGRGKGFYDRYLSNHKILKIGLAWSGQIIEEIPTEQHDCKVDFIITENFCWDVTQQKRL